MRLSVIEAINELRNDPIKEDLTYEEFLVEDLDTIYNSYYKVKIPDRKEFDRIIRLDPTFNEKSGKLGNYGKWILACWDRGEKFEGDIAQEFTHHLKAYDDYKKSNRIPADKRNILNFKNIQELMSYIDSLDSRDESAFVVKMKDIPGAEFIGQTSEYEIWHPLTHEASRKIRGNNIWCTGREDKGYWDDYKRRGLDLMIFLPKDEALRPTSANDTEGRRRCFQAALDKKSNTIKEFADGNNDHSVDFKEWVLKTGVDKELEKVSTFKDSKELSDIRDLRQLQQGKPLVYKGQELDKYIRLIAEKVEFDSSLKSIPARAFYNCIKLKVVDIPSTIKTIGEAAFENCSDLVAIRFPEGLKNISLNTCKNCKSLKKVDLPASVDNIEWEAFKGCDESEITCRNEDIKVALSDRQFMLKHIKWAA